MKKTITKILLIFSLLGLIGMNFIENSYAGDMKVTVTEKIPGAKCVCAGSTLDGVCYGPPSGLSDYPPALWNCTVESGFKSVLTMMGAVIKYFTFIAGLGGVLFIVINGIMYSMGGIDQGMKDEAKKRIVKTLVGLVLLFLSGAILNMVAPWVYV